MKPDTQAWLDSLLWLAGAAAQPSLTNLFHPPGRPPVSSKTAKRLEKHRLISRKVDEAGKWVYQLTRHGALAALGGRNPDHQWTRDWDGLWRFILFDIPRADPNTRLKLHRWFHRNHFGCLQGSVWITPDPISNIARSAKLGKAGSRNIILTEGTLPEQTAAQIATLVSQTWNFPELNNRYKAYLAIVKEQSAGAVSADWRRREFHAWRTALAADPLLPNAILPKGYLGKKAWEQRQRFITGNTTSLENLL
jgi:phenylacetic acid degradation operon negative regulatory protein